MKQKFFLFILMGIFFISSISSIPVLYAAGHGCSMNEPDRDGDGVPDQDDAYPDDPTLTES